MLPSPGARPKLFISTRQFKAKVACNEAEVSSLTLRLGTLCSAVEVLASVFRDPDILAGLLVEALDV